MINFLLSLGQDTPVAGAKQRAVGAHRCAGWPSTRAGTHLERPRDLAVADARFGNDAADDHSARSICRTSAR